MIIELYQENRKRAEEERRRRALREENEKEAAKRAQEKLEEEARIRNEEIDRLEVLSPFISSSLSFLFLFAL